MEIELIVTLLLSGVTVGFINTLAGGATVISMAIFMACGLPIIQAAGTNRIAVLMQNLVSTCLFRRQSLIDLKVALKLSVPIILGSIVGAQYTMLITDGLYSLLFFSGLVFLMTMMLLKPTAGLNTGADSIKKTSPLLWTLLFLSGIYSGCVYVGVGYFFIAIFAVGYGYDLIRANALKGFMALILTPASLAIFIYNGEVNFAYGLVHGVGNIVGAYMGSKYATKLGVGFIRKLLIVMIIVSAIDLARKPVFRDYIVQLFFKIIGE